MIGTDQGYPARTAERVMALLDPPPAGGVEDDQREGEESEGGKTGVFHEMLLVGKKEGNSIGNLVVERKSEIVFCKKHPFCEQNEVHNCMIPWDLVNF